MRTAKKDITEEKEKGRIYTPEYIVNAILNFSGYKGNCILKRHAIDNSCGDGAFLKKIVKRYCEEAVRANYSSDELKNDLQTYIHGIEIDNDEQKSCISNLNNIIKEYKLQDIEWDVLCGDALTEDKYNRKMDFVLGNPPYVRVHNLGNAFDEIKKFSFSQGGMTDLFIVFYEVGLRMLKPSGTLGYITPNSVFNSLAGKHMRSVLMQNNLLDKVIDLKHYQAFNATAYTAILILRKNKNNSDVEYYEFDEEKLSPKYVERLKADDYYIAGNFYFSKKENLKTMKKIQSNFCKCDIEVKNGYATLCDDVFVNDFEFESPYIIPAVKSSKGQRKKILFPYDKECRLIPEEELKKDKNVYKYLSANKEKLLKRSNEKDSKTFWYAFGRSQAISDTYRDKVAINSLIRNKDDFKFTEAPAGTGVYGGLYIISDTIPAKQILEALKSDEFINYIALIGKYKSGGYYTYSSKDVKAYLDYKFNHDGGIL